jgi:multiple sugar transport system ATP-binding protein
MTVLQNIMFPLTVGKNKRPKAEAEKVARKYMNLTQIDELRIKNLVCFPVVNSSV